MYIAKEVSKILDQPLQHFAQRSRPVTIYQYEPSLEPTSILLLRPDLSETPTNQVSNHLAEKNKEYRQIRKSWLMLACRIYEIEDSEGFFEWVAVHHKLMGVEPNIFLHKIREGGSVPGRHTPF